MVNAVHTVPAQVETYVKSAAHNRFGAPAGNWRFTSVAWTLVQCLAIDFTVSYAVRYESSSGAVGDIRWATRSPGNFG